MKKNAIKVYYTFDEMNQYLDRIETKRNVSLNRKTSSIFGFNCVYNFLETSFGWVASFEDCCPYCVHSLIKSYGSKEDKLKFNANMNLDENYVIPITRKEIALNEKKVRKSRSSKKILNKSKRIHARELKSRLEKLKKAGISTLRKTKKNIDDDIFFFFPCGELSKKLEHHDKIGISDFIFVKGLRKTPFHTVVCNFEELEKALFDEIQRQNTQYNLSIEIPTNIKEQLNLK